MAQDLSQNFILHGGVGLASDRISEFGFYHTERGFNVRTKVVTFHESVPVMMIGVEHLSPQSSSFVCGIVLEWNQRGGTQGGNRFQVLFRRVCKIGGDLQDIKVVSCVGQQGWEQWRVVGVWAVNLHGCDDVGFYSAHDMGFHPSSLDSFLAVLVVKPAVKARGTKTGGIACKTGFQRFQGQAAPSDEVHENRRGGFGFQGIENRVMAGQFVDDAFGMRCSEITHEPASRYGGVHLEDGREKKVRNWKRTPPCLGTGGLGNTSTEIPEQDLEMVFFVGLGSVVSLPALAQGLGCLCRRLNACSHPGAVLTVSFNCKFNGPYMFALHPTGIEVGAGASGGAVESNRVVPRSTLRWDKPLACVLNNPGVVGDANGSELSLVHGFSFLCREGRGILDNVRLPRCHEHFAGYGLAGCNEHSAGPISGYGRRGWDSNPRSQGLAGSPDFESGPINRYGTPPSSSFLDQVVTGSPFTSLRFQLFLLHESSEGCVDDRKRLGVPVNGKASLLKVISDGDGSKPPLGEVREKLPHCIRKTHCCIYSKKGLKAGNGLNDAILTLTDFLQVGFYVVFFQRNLFELGLKLFKGSFVLGVVSHKNKYTQRG